MQISVYWLRQRVAVIFSNTTQLSPKCYGLHQLMVFTWDHDTVHVYQICFQINHIWEPTKITPLNLGVWCSERVSNSWSTSDTRRVTRVDIPMMKVMKVVRIQKVCVLVNQKSYIIYIVIHYSNKYNYLHFCIIDTTKWLAGCLNRFEM
jgi:hypothetical protein